MAGAEVFAIGASSTATGFMLMANSAENMNGGYERGNTSTGNKNSKHANLNAKGNLNNISMNTFTFITEYIGGTYISQFESLDMMTAFDQWVTDFSHSEFITEKEGTVIRWWASQDDMPPCAIENVINIWFWEVRINKKYLRLHIIKTNVT